MGSEIRSPLAGALHATRPALRAPALACALFAVTPGVHADVVMDWNEVAFKALTTARQGPPMGVRTMAVVHTAMFDAMNAVQPATAASDSTVRRPPVPPPTSREPAAHAALVKFFPDQRAAFDEALAKTIAAAPPGTARDAGAALGKSVAEGLLAWCAEDRVGAATHTGP